MNKLLDTDLGAVHRVMTLLKVQTFTDADIGFLKEYEQVMSIPTKALDKMRIRPTLVAYCPPSQQPL
jgi:hypothetical protein